MKGKFITVEGLDGAGKSTQVDRIAAILDNYGIVTGNRWFKEGYVEQLSVPGLRRFPYSYLIFISH